MKFKTKKSFGIDKILIIFVALILCVYTISILLLLLWGFLNSLKSNLDFQIFGNVLNLPSLERSSEEIKFSNYFYIFDRFTFRQLVDFYSMFGEEHHEVNVSFLDLIFNTLVIAGLGSVLTTFFPMLVSYLCAKFKYRFSSIVFWFVIVAMSIPAVGTYPAELEMLRTLNLYDSWLGYILQKSFFTGMYFLVFYAFFKDLDNGFIEAAEIDGASDYRIMFSIVFPLALKIFASVMLIQFVALWNDYQMAYLYMPTHPTLAFGVWRVAYGSNDGFINTIPCQLAACMILALPIIIVYAIFRDRLMGNLTMGGLKG